MDDNKLISKVNSIGIYQIILTIIISLINSSVFFSLYFVAFLGTPPYVQYITYLNNTEQSMLTDEICNNHKSFTIDETLSKTHFLLDKLINLDYCNKFNITIFYFSFTFVGYAFVFSNLLCKPRINFIVSFILFFLGIIIFSITYYINVIYLHRYMNIFLLGLLFLQIFSSNIITSSLHFVSGLTNKLHRTKLINCIIIIPSNLSLLFCSLIYENNIDEEGFFLMMNIFPAIILLFGMIFIFLSVENPKFYNHSELDSIRETLTHICRINYFHNKLEYEKKIENFDLNNNDNLEIHPRKQYLINSEILVTKTILLFMLLYFLSGIIFQVTTIQLRDYSYDINSKWYILIYLNIVIMVLVGILNKKDELYIISTFLYIILSLFKFFFIDYSILHILCKLILDYTVGKIFSTSLTYFFKVIDKKRRLVNTILMLCFYHGVTIAPFCNIYSGRIISNIITFSLSISVLVIQLFLNYSLK